MKTKQWISLVLVSALLTGCASRSMHFARPASFLDSGGGNRVTITLRDGRTVETVHRETRPEGLVTAQGLIAYADINRYVWGGAVSSKPAPVRHGAIITLKLTDGRRLKTRFRGANADTINTDDGNFPADEIQEISWSKVRGGELAASIGLAYVVTATVLAWLVKRAFEDAFDGGDSDG